MTVVLARLAVATAIAATSLAHAGDPVPLNKEETQKALAGKSLSYASRGSVAGSTVVIFFTPEGRMTVKFSNNPRTSSGTWSVEDDGRYCLKVTSGTFPDGCRRLLKTDTGYAMKTGSGEIVPVDKME
jgi:hypothetical protein